MLALKVFMDWVESWGQKFGAHQSLVLIGLFIFCGVLRRANTEHVIYRRKKTFKSVNYIENNRRMKRGGMNVNCWPLLSSDTSPALSPNWNRHDKIGLLWLFSNPGNQTETNTYHLLSFDLVTSITNKTQQTNLHKTIESVVLVYEQREVIARNRGRCTLKLFVVVLLFYDLFHVYTPVGSKLRRNCN